MFIKLNAAAPIGLDCTPVEVEVDLNKGQTAFNIVGLPDASIQEAKSRIYSALKNSGFYYPFNFRILINLAPADLHKEGTSYDLPMAVGIISISNNLEINLQDCLLMGELALDGSLRHINAALPLTLFAKQQGLTKIFLPEINAPEAALVGNLEIYPVKNLQQIIDHLTGSNLIKSYQHVINQDDFETPVYQLDMAMIKGQEFAKRALEIAASGGHNILMSGPPGAGKTLLAKTLPSILPRLTIEEALEITRIYSTAGLLNGQIIKTRPLRMPHHTASNVALVGGGKYPRPGEISLAHRGVLFLDELPEFSRTSLESLRQPLEDGVITISRAQGSCTFPARFILVASQNPCPCGYRTDPIRECSCTQIQLMSYQKKVSGPLLDRIDLHVEVPRVKLEHLISTQAAESSDAMRRRAERARKIQTRRFKNLSIYTNGEMDNAAIKKYCQLDLGSINLFKKAIDQLQLSARAHNRILKVARTIADLAGDNNIQTKHLTEAIQYRAKQLIC